MPQKQKISVEEKIKLVLECLENKISVQEAARSAGVDFATVKIWISVYENEGAEGFVHRGQKVYTAETKTAAVIDYLHGEGSLQEICKKYGIRDRRILRNWIKVYNVHGNFDSLIGTFMRTSRMKSDLPTLRNSSGMKALRFTKSISAQFWTSVTAALLPTWSANGMTIRWFSRPLTVR